MPPKRRHDSESSSGAAAVKRIRIVAKNEQFICTDCGASLESVKQLNSHMRRHKTFLCDKCNKVHVLYTHVKDFISKCGHTMAMFSDEPIETCHGRLRFMERRHNYRCRSLVGKYKSQRSKASFDMWNRKNLYSIDKKKWKIKRYW